VGIEHDYRVHAVDYRRVGQTVDALGRERRALLLAHHGDGLNAGRILLVERDLRDAGHIGGNGKRQIDNAGHGELSSAAE